MNKSYLIECKDNIKKLIVLTLQDQDNFEAKREECIKIISSFNLKQIRETCKTFNQLLKCSQFTSQEKIDLVEDENFQFITYFEQTTFNTIYQMFKNIKGKSVSQCSEILNSYTRIKSKKWGLRFFFMLSELIQKISLKQKIQQYTQQLSNFQKLEEYIVQKFPQKNQFIYYNSKADNLDVFDKQLMKCFKETQSLKSKSTILDSNNKNKSSISQIGQKNDLTQVKYFRKKFVDLCLLEKIDIQKLISIKDIYQKTVLNCYKIFENSIDENQTEQEFDDLVNELQYANDAFQCFDQLVSKDQALTQDYQYLQKSLLAIHKKFFPNEKSILKKNGSKLMKQITQSHKINQSNLQKNDQKVNHVQDLNKYLGRNIRKRSKQNLSKNKFAKQYIQKALQKTNKNDYVKLQKDLDVRTPDIDTTQEPFKSKQIARIIQQQNQPQLILYLIKFTMEFLRNEIIKFLLKIFLAMLVMDVLSRTFLNPEKILNKNQIQEKDTQNTVQHISEKVKEDIRSNDDLIKNDYENQVGYLGDPNQIVNLTVQICNSCGYKKNFEELKNFLESQINNLHVFSEEYPLHPLKKLFAKLLSYSQMGLMILMMCGGFIFQKLNMPEPEIYRKLQQHKMAVFFGLYFIGNTVSNMLTNSGAFEVLFNENLLFSKLEQGKFPNNYYILNQLKSFFY